MIIATDAHSLGWLFLWLPLAMLAFRRCRLKKLVRCPETGGMAVLDIDVPRGALSSPNGKPPHIRSCTAGPKRRNCRAACLKKPAWS